MGLCRTSPQEHIMGCSPTRDSFVGPTGDLFAQLGLDEGPTTHLGRLKTLPESILTWIQTYRVPLGLGHMLVGPNRSHPLPSRWTLQLCNRTIICSQSHAHMYDLFGMEQRRFGWKGMTKGQTDPCLLTSLSNDRKRTGEFGKH